MTVLFFKRRGVYMVGCNVMLRIRSMKVGSFSLDVRLSTPHKSWTTGSMSMDGDDGR